MNIGCEAGQTQEHFHVQLYPRREPGMGVSTAMREIL